MKSKLVVIVLALLLVGGIASTAVALAISDEDADTVTHGKAFGKAQHDKKHDKQRDKKTEKQNGMHGFDRDSGPPPWARGGGPGGDKAWKEYWRALTPAQRADTMAKLAQEHADGMKKWAACVKTAGEDKGARAACERPLPPGLAKKRLGR